ncbi:MAG: hypothetical protein OXI41_05445 [Chloroflexota bacterium]|nr:hypothetical protein [Chloroflexota bacterium]MDE2894840.1 hypothetical protein [Chloroflexota bacterium]
MTVSDALGRLTVGRGDDVAIAVSDRLTADSAARLSKGISDRLTEMGVPVSQRTWIVATAGDDEAAARIAAAVSDVSGGARVMVHDPREPDGLTFERRNPGQRRGGVYLNHAWQSASVRIGCGDGLALADGLSAWFNSAAQLSADDLHADLLIDG